MSLSDNPLAYGSGKFSVLGKDVPSLGGTDWGSMVGPEAFRGFTSSDKGGSGDSDGKPKAADWLKAFAFNAFDGAAGSRKWRDEAEKESGPKIGTGTSGGGGKVLENLGVVYPQQHAPIVIPGVQNQRGTRGGTIGRLAGTALGLGASALIPGVGPMVGASIGGSLGGGVGSLFD